jgi:hypothetical protein
MNVEKCATLHNQIFELAWYGSGRTSEQFALNCKPWFELYGAGAQAMRPSLSSDLAAYLERTYVAQGEDFSFFYYVYGLMNPEGLFGDYAAEFINEVWSDEGEQRYAMLYAMNDFGSHGAGLMYVHFLLCGLAELRYNAFSKENQLRPTYFPRDCGSKHPRH